MPQFIYRANGHSIANKVITDFFVILCRPSIPIALFCTIECLHCVYETKRVCFLGRFAARSVPVQFGNKYDGHRSISVRTVGRRFTHFIDSFRSDNRYIRLVNERRLMRIHCLRIVAVANRIHKITVLIIDHTSKRYEICFSVASFAIVCAVCTLSKRSQTTVFMCVCKEIS